jgi:hypothetical protein
MSAMQAKGQVQSAEQPKRKAPQHVSIKKVHGRQKTIEITQQHVNLALSSPSASENKERRGKCKKRQTAAKSIQERECCRNSSKLRELKKCIHECVTNNFESMYL